ncbi:MAG: XylR family transcriptional regulator [Planctomycetota bacterium]|jgi:LacI family transcriptional regulator
MSKALKVILLLESSREYGRQLQLGITRYSYFNGPWTFYREPGGRDRTLPRLRDWGANGIIAHAKDAATARWIMDTGIPAIVKGSKVEGCPLLDADNRAIGIMGAEHLIDRGFQRFAYCGYDDLYWSVERARAFAERIEQETFDVFLYKQPRARKKRSWDVELARIAQWLKSLPTPVGLMTCVDERSQHVLHACKMAGLDVPSEVAIVGVDNDELTCCLANPQLSSIALAAQRAGYETAGLLDRLMAGERVDNPVVTTQATHVVTRQSTDVLAMDDRTVAKALSHATDPIQVTDVVNAIPLSRRALQKRFQTALGRTILDEIRHTRVDKVAQMLTGTNLSIAQIALACGYPGIDHISRSFGNIKHMSPLAYRKRYGQK